MATDIVSQNSTLVETQITTQEYEEYARLIDTEPRDLDEQEHALAKRMWAHEVAEEATRTRAERDVELVHIDTTCGAPNPVYRLRIALAGWPTGLDPTVEEIEAALASIVRTESAPADAPMVEPITPVEAVLMDMEETEDHEISKIVRHAKEWVSGEAAQNDTTPQPQPEDHAAAQAQPPPQPEAEINSPLAKVLALVAEAEDSGKSEPLFKTRGLLAQLTDGEFSDVIGEVKRAVKESKAGLHVDIRALNRDRKKYQATARQTKSIEANFRAAAGKPMITVSNRQLSDLRAEAVAKLLEANDPPTVFQRLRELVRFRVDALGEPYLERLDDLSLRGRLADIAHFYVEGANGAQIAVFPPRAVCEDILAYDHPNGAFPVVEGITQSPLVRADGSICAMPGFDAASRMIYCPRAGFVLPNLPENPTAADIESAKKKILEPLVNFDFESNADRTNFIAFAMTPIIRQLVDVVPLANVDSPVAGSGKGLLTDLACVVATGEVAAVIPPPANREEWPKLLASLLDNGRTFIVFDNLHGTLSSDALEATLTKPYLQFRQLGHTRERIVPNRATWCVTGNNIELSRDMVRRTYRIRIDPRCSRPHMRKGFTYPNLVAHCKADRGNLLAALLVLVRAWFAAGKPAFGGPALGTFSEWKEMVGGILKHAGFEDFLGNQRKLYTEADQEGEAWENFLEVAEARFGKEVPFTVNNLIAMMQATTVTLPAEIARVFGQTTTNKMAAPNPYFAVQLGNVLRGHRNTRFGDAQIYLERIAPDKHRKIAMYRIRRGTA